MSPKADDESYYEQLKRRLYNNRFIAWIVLVAGAVLAALQYYGELTEAVGRIWKETGTVEFVTAHAPLLERGKVEIQRDSHAVRVTGFNAPVVVEVGAYQAAAHIDNRVLLQQPFMVEPGPVRVEFSARFAVKGIVVNGQGRPLASVVVRIDRRSARTKNDGLFVLDDLPMRRTYDIEAYPENGGTYTAQQPWTGTVYNGDWSTTVTQNIPLVW